MGNEQLFLDYTTIATLQKDGSVCCDNCGSWTDMETLYLYNGYCELCREVN